MKEVILKALQKLNDKDTAQTGSDEMKEIIQASSAPAKQLACGLPEHAGSRDSPMQRLHRPRTTRRCGVASLSLLCLCGALPRPRTVLHFRTPLIAEAPRHGHDCVCAARAMPARAAEPACCAQGEHEALVAAHQQERLPAQRSRHISPRLAGTGLPVRLSPCRTNAAACRRMCRCCSRYQTCGRFGI